MIIHKPVLLKEAVENLNLERGDVVVDATLGQGGHGCEILKRIGKSGVLVGIDLDKEAISHFVKLPVYKFKNTVLVNDDFSNIRKILEVLKIEKVDAVLADLGWSSRQLENHGMSFMKDEVLDMRLNRDQKISARDVINGYSQKELERVLRELGEEKFWKRIAKKIVEHRKVKKIEKTVELAEIIKKAVPKKYQYGRINPATRTFQAIRIEVNRELENLEKFIPEAIEILKSGGRLGIISFHSLEDRIVKNIFRQNAGGCICPPNFPQCACGKIPKVKVITRKPIIPEETEVLGNPRSRSAKLRVCEKI